MAIPRCRGTSGLENTHTLGEHPAAGRTNGTAVSNPYDDVLKLASEFCPERIQAAGNACARELDVLAGLARRDRPRLAHLMPHA